MEMNDKQTNIRRAALLCAALSLFSLAAGCKNEQGPGGPGGGPGGQMGPPPEVEVHVVKEEMLLPQVELPGRVAAYRTAEVRPQVSGILRKRLFAEGSEVQAGQTLYQIDPALFEAAVASARARIAQAEAAENSTGQKARRYRSLVKSKAVSVQEQVEMEAAWKQAKAEIAAARAALETARINLNYTAVKAPISGRIGRSMVTEGSLMTAQQANALAVIQQLDPLYVDVNQPADDMLALREKMGGRRSGAEAARVRVVLADGTELGQEGTLEFSDVTVDQGTGTVTIRGVVPNPDRTLLPGMFIRARITSRVPTPTLLVPQAALTRTQRGEEMVYVVNNASVVEQRLVHTGRNEGQMVVITDGLKAGDRVIVQGLQKVRPEVPVKIVPPKNPAPGANAAADGAAAPEQGWPTAASKGGTGGEAEGAPGENANAAAQSPQAPPAPGADAPPTEKKAE